MPMGERYSLPAVRRSPVIHLPPAIFGYSKSLTMKKAIALACGLALLGPAVMAQSEKKSGGRSGSEATEQQAAPAKDDRPGYAHWMGAKNNLEAARRHVENAMAGDEASKKAVIADIDAALAQVNAFLDQKKGGRPDKGNPGHGHGHSHGQDQAQPAKTGDGADRQ
jgi:hypothetical protein